MALNLDSVEFRGDGNNTTNDSIILAILLTATVSDPTRSDDQLVRIIADSAVSRIRVSNN